MIDKTVKFFDLFMLHHNLDEVKERALPKGFSYRFFNGSEEDKQHWIEIEVSSGDVKSRQEAEEGFQTYYADYFDELPKRCIFLLNSQGEPVGTATAFFLVENQPGLPEVSSNPESIPNGVTGHLHWVAIKEEFKGKGLSKPLITKAMNRMRELGHHKAFLHSQTPSWLACKIYLDLGWEPFRFVHSEQHFKKGWKIVGEKTKQ